MKILHVLDQLKLPRDPEQEPVGGITRVALELAREQRRLGHEVAVATVSRESGEAEWMGVRLVRLGRLWWARTTLRGRMPDLSVRLPLARFAITERFDVVHAHAEPDTRLFRAAGRFIHVHNDPIGNRPGGSSEAARRFWRRAAGSDAQFGVSRYIADRILSASCAAGSPREDRSVRVLPNGVDLERFRPERRIAEGRALRARLGIEAQDVAFLFAGAAAPHKGLIELLRAFLELCTAAPRAHLLVAGTATLWGDNAQAAFGDHARYEERCRSLVAESGSERVHLLGLLGSAEMPAAYAAADVVVVPSTVEEAFGLVALEALASSRPVIASRVGGLPELVHSGNGILLPPADVPALAGAMMLLASDTALRERLGRAGRATAAKFTWRATADRVEQAYRSVPGLVRSGRLSLVGARPVTPPQTAYSPRFR